MAIDTAEDVLPTWDMSPYFPSLESREFAGAHESIGAGVDRLVALYDDHDIRGGEPAVVDAQVAASLEAVLDATNDLQEQLRLVSAYVYAFVTTDARNDLAASLQSQLQAAAAPLRTLNSRFAAWVQRYGADELIAASPKGGDHAWPLRRAERNAAHQMSEAEEDLAAELNLTGGAAWNRLHGEFTSRISADVRGERLAMTLVRNLAMDHDAALRRDAYDAELAAWEANAVPIAAALNSIKGEANVVIRRRGWHDSLEPALFNNAVDRTTLDAMHTACVKAFPDFRRYLRVKASLLGHADGRGLPWWDLFAPVGDPSAAAVSWSEATATVSEAFGSFSPALRALADRAFAESWVDAEAHDGKRGGAFCMPVRGDESRVLLNFAGSFDSVSTLAHELGHAYHNTNLAGRTPLQRHTPMALAETASIFCETILVQAGLAEAGDDPARQLALLDVDLTGATQVVVDIHSRFRFEREVFDQRSAHTLSVSELCNLMTDAQLATYGDGLDPDALHPYMWAVKPHYYSTAFYNWPYCFGLLFGIGLYARYVDDPDRFRLGYDDLLSATGLGEAADLAARFGIDVRDETFWTASLDVIRTRIDRYEQLAHSTPGAGPR